MPGSPGSGTGSPAPPPAAPPPRQAVPGRRCPQRGWGAPHASRRGLRPPPPRREPAPGGWGRAGARGPQQRPASNRGEPGLPPLSPRERRVRPARPVPLAAPALPVPTFCQIPRPPPARGRTPGVAEGRAPWPAGAPLGRAGGRAAVAEALPLPGGRGSGCRPGRPRCHSSGAAARSVFSLCLSFSLSRCLTARLAARRRRRGAGSGSAARPRQRRPRPPPPARGTWIAGTPGAGESGSEPQLLRTAGHRPQSGALGRVGFLVMSFCILNFLKEDGYALLTAKLPSKAKSVTIWPSFNQPNLPNNKAF